MLRLVVALALGASAQAFVAAPQHRLSLPSCMRGHDSSTVRIRDGDGPSYGRPRRGYAVSPRSSANNNNNSKNNVSMRAGRSGRGNNNVEIEGAGGETRRVEQRRTRRRPDLRSMQQVGVQTAAAAAAVLVKQDQGVDLQTEAEQAAEAAEYDSLAEQYATMQGNRERSMMEEEQSGTVLDKYTQIYIPADGIIIKKTYGFWTWQVFGLIFIQHFVRNIIRKGGSLKKTSMSELNWDHIVTEPEHLLELKAYCCEECGYTLFPARGRHEVFFDEVEDFKCPECEAPRSAFYDANDKDDPHNQKRNEELEAKTGEEGGDAGGDDAGGVVASAAAGGPSSGAGAKKPSATPAESSSTPKNAPPESSSKGGSAAGKANPSSANEQRKEGDDGDGEDGDLLDF